MKICNLSTPSASLTAPQIEALSTNQAARMLSRRLEALWAIVPASRGNGALIDTVAARYMAHEAAPLDLLVAVDGDLHELVDRSREAARPTVADIVDHVRRRAA